jgi:hypothetical protein
MVKLTVEVTAGVVNNEVAETSDLDQSVKLSLRAVASGSPSPPWQPQSVKCSGGD